MATQPDLTDAELVELRRRRDLGELDREECCAALDRLLPEVERRRADELLAERQRRLAEAYLARGLTRRPRK